MLGSMTTRKKIILSASSVVLVPVLYLYIWPIAHFIGKTPLRYSVGVVLAVRTHTLYPIYSMEQEPSDPEVRVQVIAGPNRPVASSSLSGDFAYEYKKTWYGWKLGTCTPVQFGYGGMSMRHQPPNKSPEPTAVGAVSSAVAVHVASRRWLSFLR